MTIYFGFQEATDPRVKAVLDGRQLALKVIHALLVNIQLCNCVLSLFLGRYMNLVLFIIGTTMILEL